VYDRLPKMVASRLPTPKPPEYFPKEPGTDELEVRIRVETGFRADDWDIGVADDDGWETKAPSYIAPRGSKWIRLGSAFPRGSEKLYIRFHPSTRKEPHMTAAERGNEFTELTVNNPFYDISTAAKRRAARLLPEVRATKGGTLPITKPFHGGSITLTRFARESTVGDGYGMLHTEFTLQRDGKPLPGYDWAFDVTDSSGQVFRQPVRLRDSVTGGILTVRAYTAPWNDDSAWTLRLSLWRVRGSADIKDDEVFRFENLPLPGSKAIKLNRSLTRNGTTLQIATLSVLQNRQAYFTVTGWTAGNPLRRIVIKDARDDQGRTEVEGALGSRAFIVGASTDYGPTGPTFSVMLPRDAKSWEVSLVPETISQLDFTVQPPPVK
jgi:hypothetical protein